jgi:hypothetical protein
LLKFIQVSDDDIAFGCDEEDDDDWEDTDAEDSGDEMHEERVRVDSSSSEYDNLNFDRRHDTGRLQTLAEEQRCNSGASMSANEVFLDEKEEAAVAGRSRNNSLAHSTHESPDANLEPHIQDAPLDTVQSGRPETPVGEDVKYVDETNTSRYETFASVAAKKGVTTTDITPGSPEQSWLDFIPGFMGKKAKPNDKKQTAKNIEAPASPKTSPALGFAESLTPAKHHHSPVSAGSTVKYRYDDDQHSNEPITPNSLYTSHFNYKPTATSLGLSMPTTPLSLSPVVDKTSLSLKQSTDGSGFGVSLNSSLLPSNETTGLLTTSSSFRNFYGQQSQQSITPTRDNRRNASTSSAQYQFYSFQDNHDEHEEHYETDNKQSHGLDMRKNHNMFSYYDDGYFSVRSQNTQQHHKSDNPAHLRLPSLSAVPEHPHGQTENTGGFIMNFLLGRADEPEAGSTQGLVRKSSSGRKRKVNMKRKRERMRRQRELQRRRELVPDNLRVAHVRASAITERFRGLLRAEVEKIILFANSRLGELSDTIGSLRYSSYEEGNQSVRRAFPNLDDGGIHPCSSSDDDEGDSISCASSEENHHEQAQFDQSDREKRHNRYESDSSNEKGIATKRQLVVRDRLRISRPLFQKAGFLGEDFSLLSAVDEADAYTAIGVELMHLLKFV